MGNITLITGGAASGKTRWAVSYFKTCSNVLFMNTDDEMTKEDRNRMEYSNKENNVEWDVVNGVSNPVEHIRNHRYFILDSLPGYCTRLMRQLAADTKNITNGEFQRIRSQAVNSIIECMGLVREMNGSMVITTLEPGFSVNPKDKEQFSFRSLMGAVNQRIANTADEVFLSVSGIQFRIK